MIGIFDSGSGGLTILSALQKKLPNENFMYLGDHARTPYGERPNDEIITMTKDMTEHLFLSGCSLVVLACNTASTIALRHLQENWLEDTYPNNRILGVHIPVVEALTGLTWEREGTKKNLSHEGGTVVVFATSKTVSSGTYSRQVGLRTANYNIVEQACPRLASLIENSQSEDKINKLVKDYVEEAMAKCDNKPNAVILGCTHYPLILNVFKKHLPKNVKILNQPEIVASSLHNYLIKHKDRAAKKPEGKISFLTTDKLESIRQFGNIELSQEIKFKRI